MITRLHLFRLFLSLLISGMWSRFPVWECRSLSHQTYWHALVRYSNIQSNYEVNFTVYETLAGKYIYSIYIVVRNVTTIRRLDGAISTWTFRYFLAFVSTSVLYLTMHLSAFLRSNKINPGNYSRLFIYYHLLLLINQEDNRFQIFNFFFTR